MESVGCSGFRGPTERMNADFADSAPKVADLADIWPYFGADKTGGYPLKIRHKAPKSPKAPKKPQKSPKKPQKQGSQASGFSGFPPAADFRPKIRMTGTPASPAPSPAPGKAGTNSILPLRGSGKIADIHSGFQ